MASRVNRAPPVKHYDFLVSACLAGINCTYKGKNKLRRRVKKLVDKDLAIPVCPEVLGGLSIPRANSEIAGGNGGDVLCGRARVITVSGKNISKNFIKGAKQCLNIARKYKIKKAILKSNSPACGHKKIYDGTFRHVLKRGDGVLTAVLRKNGIRIYRED